jgi:molybdate-binding protein
VTPTLRRGRAALVVATLVLSLRAAAQALGLGFVPVASEPYDLMMGADGLDDPCSRRSSR